MTNERLRVYEAQMIYWRSVAERLMADMMPEAAERIYDESCALIERVCWDDADVITATHDAIESVGLGVQRIFVCSNDDINESVYPNRICLSQNRT